MRHSHRRREDSAEVPWAATVQQRWPKAGACSQAGAPNRGGVRDCMFELGRQAVAAAAAVAGAAEAAAVLAEAVPNTSRMSSVRLRSATERMAPQKT